MVTEARLIESAVAPRVSLEQLEATIVGEFYFTAYDGASQVAAEGKWLVAHDVEVPAVLDHLKLLTFCVLVLKNGFTVTGESACADPKNYNANIGRELARKAAVGKVWPLLGYELKSKVALVAESTQPTTSAQETYIGTKVIHAFPMTRFAYNALRGWTLPTDENGEDEGYLVEYADGSDGNVPGFKGYVSWSPKEVFEKSYKVFV